MAKTKQTKCYSKPEPIPFLKPTSTTIEISQEEGHVVSTSAPASPDEPQPTLDIMLQEATALGEQEADVAQPSDHEQEQSRRRRRRRTG